MERSRRAIGPQATANSLFGRWHRLSKVDANMTELMAANIAAESEPQSKDEHALVDSCWPRASLTASAAADRIANIVASCCTALEDSIIGLVLVCDAMPSERIVCIMGQLRHVRQRACLHCFLRVLTWVDGDWTQRLVVM